MIPPDGVIQNSHNCYSAHSPANTATPVLRAGLIEESVTSMLIRWMSVNPSPIAKGASPAGALRCRAHDDEQEHCRQYEFCHSRIKVAPPRYPMPTLGRPAAMTALPQLPNVSHNVRQPGGIFFRTHDCPSYQFHATRTQARYRAWVARSRVLSMYWIGKSRGMNETKKGRRQGLTAEGFFNRQRREESRVENTTVTAYG